MRMTGLPVHFLFMLFSKVLLYVDQVVDKLDMSSNRTKDPSSILIKSVRPCAPPIHDQAKPDSVNSASERTHGNSIQGPFFHKNLRYDL